MVEAELKQIMASRRNSPAVTKAAAALAGDLGKALMVQLCPQPGLTTAGTTSRRSPSQRARRISVESVGPT